MHNLSYNYDPNSNIEHILNLANPAQNQSFGYDALDRLIDAAGGYGTLGYAYDPIGNRLQEIQTTEGTEHTEIYQYGTQNHQLLQRGNVNYQYDAVGNTVYNGAQAFIYNQMNRLSRVEQEGEQIAEYRYNALGQRTLKTTGSIDTTDYLALAEEQEALAQQYRDNAQAKQQQAATLDQSAEDLTEQAAQNQAEATVLRNEAIQDRLEADALETEAVPLEAEAQPWVERADRFRARIVEPPQNRRDEIRNAVFSAVASIFQGIADVYLNEAAELRTEAQALRDGANQKEQQAATLEAEAAQLLFDAQQARKQTAQLRSEAEALIALAEAAENLAAEYRELAENPPNVQVTILFVYDQGGLLIGVYTEQGPAIKEYVYLNGQPLALLDEQDEVYYYHVDHLGTSKTLTNQSQQAAWKAEYEPFGEVILSMGAVTNNLRFPGQYFDTETGFHYNYFRDYDPRAGRYIESDPIGLRGGLNTYLYANANPLKLTDPLGLLGNCGMPGGSCVPPNNSKARMGVFGCAIAACASYVEQDADAQVSMSLALGGGILICTAPKEPKKECEDEQPKKDCGMYDPNCDDQVVASPSMNPVPGFGIGVNVNTDGSICIAVGPFVSPLPMSVSKGDLHE